MPFIPSASPLEARDLSAGAKAGVSVGTIVGSILLVLCLWPVVARYVFRRRKQHAATDPPPVAEPSAVEAQPVAEVQDESGDRRMSRDSYGIGPDGRPICRQSTKDLTLDPCDGTNDFTTQPPPSSVAAASSSPAPGSPTSAPPQIDTNFAQMVASCERRGYSGSYYNTNIPTEAFGVTPWEDPRAPRSGTKSSSKFSAGSLIGSILRRATSQKSTTAASAAQPGYNITTLGFSESPTELEAPPNALSRSPHSSRSSEEGDRALDLGDIDFPPASSPPAPPAQPPPGTVNPMEVMGATTTKEQTWRTNAELMNLAASPVSYSTPDHSPELVLNGDPTLGLSPQSPEESGSQPPTPSPYPAVDHGDGSDQLHGQGLAPSKPIPEVVVKDETAFPTTNFDTVPPINGQAPQYGAAAYTNSADIYYTDHSTHSTPFPAPSPSGGSISNTPDTGVSDSTPSPLPVTPENKQGLSPNSGLSASPQTPQILVCDKCNQKFDQPHKLKYVQVQNSRYREPICANSVIVTINGITTGHTCVSVRGVASGSAPRPILTVTSTTSMSRQGATTVPNRLAYTRDKVASRSLERTTCGGIW